MRVIKEIMGFRLVPPVVLMPGMKIIHVEALPLPDSDTLQVYYDIISNQSATELYEEYKQFYGKLGQWQGNISKIRYVYYPFNISVPPSNNTATFGIFEVMPIDFAKYIGSQREYAKSFIGVSIWVPFAYSQKYQQQHHGAVQYLLPVDPAH